MLIGEVRLLQISKQVTFIIIMEDVKIHDYSSLFSLKGKVAVVTGGSRGLGLTAASA